MYKILGTKSTVPVCTLILCLWKCFAVNTLWSVVTNALADVPKCPALGILGDKIEGVPVSKMRFVTLGCLAAEDKIAMNGKMRTPTWLSWLEEFLDFIFELLMCNSVQYDERHHQDFQGSFVPYSFYSLRFCIPFVYTV